MAIGASTGIEVAAEDLVEHGDIDRLRLADEAEIDDAFSMLESGSTTRAARLAGGDHVAVLAAEPDRAAAGAVDEADDLLVDRAGQHHLDDLDRSPRR